MLRKHLLKFVTLSSGSRALSANAWSAAGRLQKIPWKASLGPRIVSIIRKSTMRCPGFEEEDERYGVATTDRVSQHAPH
jgi:hypothetical protein